MRGYIPDTTQLFQLPCIHSSHNDVSDKDLDDFKDFDFLNGSGGSKHKGGITDLSIMSIEPDVVSDVKHEHSIPIYYCWNFIILFLGLG